MQKTGTNLWFDTQAEEAADFYSSVIPNSSMGAVSRNGKEGHDIHGMTEGTAMTVDFVLEGQQLVALNVG